MSRSSHIQPFHTTTAERPAPPFSEQREAWYLELRETFPRTLYKPLYLHMVLSAHCHFRLHNHGLANIFCLCSHACRTRQCSLSQASGYRPTQLWPNFLVHSVHLLREYRVLQPLHDHKLELRRCVTRAPFYPSHAAMMYWLSSSSQLPGKLRLCASGIWGRWR